MICEIKNSLKANPDPLFSINRYDVEKLSLLYNLQFLKKVVIILYSAVL